MGSVTCDEGEGERVNKRGGKLRKLLLSVLSLKFYYLLLKSFVGLFLIVTSVESDAPPVAETGESFSGR